MSVLVISSLVKNKDNTTAVEFKIDIAQFIDLTDRIGSLFHLSILPGNKIYVVVKPSAKDHKAKS